MRCTVKCTISERAEKDVADALSLCGSWVSRIPWRRLWTQQQPSRASYYSFLCPTVRRHCHRYWVMHCYYKKLQQCHPGQLRVLKTLHNLGEYSSTREGTVVAECSSNKLHNLHSPTAAAPLIRSFHSAASTLLYGTWWLSLCYCFPPYLFTFFVFE